MILWLSSYPKSGNTWVRSLISNYINYKNGKSVFENLKYIKRFPNQSQFDWVDDKEILKKDKFEICKYWIPAQERLNLKNKFTILKTHNFGGSIKDNWFTNLENTCGFVYIVRDPRSVVISKSFHHDNSIEESLKSLISPNTFVDNENNLIEIRSSWKIHYLSWINRKYPNILIKYEDLHSNIFETFKKILVFLNKFEKIEIDNNKIKDVIELCSFDKLSSEETKYGFRENQGRANFFRKGLIDEWKNILTKEQIKIIEDNFKDEMVSLGYL
tara:strand:+ start:1640 stop:2455 length:816 start_codon:yes stop_codon:yes gene_type:complete